MMWHVTFLFALRKELMSVFSSVYRFIQERYDSYQPLLAVGPKRIAVGVEFAPLDFLLDDPTLVRRYLLLRC